MTKTERLVGLIGGVLAILGFIDTYILKSKIANALSLPPQVPTGFLFAVALLFGLLLLVLSARNSRLASKAVTLSSDVNKLQQDLDRTDADRQRLEKELLSAQARSSELEQLIHSSETSRQNQAEYVQRLKKQITAVLTRNLSEVELQNRLGMQTSEQKSTLREALGEMVIDKLIRRGVSGFDYELCD